jgi:hypothetical protein
MGLNAQKITSSFLEVNGQKLKSLEGEIWKPVGDNYFISTKGRLATSNHRNTRLLKVMKPAKDANGYLRTSILINGKNTTIKMHRLVAQAFIENPLNKPQVNHIDFDRTNNKLENLEWCTASENAMHSVKEGRFNTFKKGEKQHKNCLKRGEDNGKAVLTEKDVLEIRAKFKPRVYTRKMLALEYGVKDCTIKDVILRRSWNHVK